MRNTIVLEVNDVFLTDFSDNIPTPVFIESTETGVRILFDDIDELKSYQQTLLAEQDNTAASDESVAVKAKLKSALKTALREHLAVLESITAYANALFHFIFNAEAHRQDKINIFDAMMDEIREAGNSWELEKSIKESTYELGETAFNHKLTFYNYAHNQVDFNFEKIKSRLIKDLMVLKISLDEKV